MNGLLIATLLFGFAGADPADAGPAAAQPPDGDAGAPAGAADDDDDGAASEAPAAEPVEPDAEPAPPATAAEKKAAAELLEDAPLAVSADARDAAEALLDDGLVEPEPEEGAPATAPATASPAPTVDDEQVEKKPAPPPPEKTRGSVRWDDAKERIPRLAGGALGACEALILPITWLPAIGETASAITEWLCLVPATLVVDYLGVFHGGTGTSLWQPFVALLFAKLWRDAVALTGIVIGVASVVGFTAVFGAVTAAVLLTPQELAGNTAAYLPTVGLAGLLTVLGTTVVVTRWAQDAGGDLMFRQLYAITTEDVRSDQKVASAQRDSFFRPPLDPFSRVYALLIATLAVEPPGDWTQAIPVAGPLLGAPAAAQAVEDEVRKFGADVLDEKPQHPEALTLISKATVYAEAGLAAAAHTLLIIGGASFVVGLLAAPIVFDQSGDLAQYVIVAATVGSASVVLAGLGVVALLLGEVPRVARGVAVPFAFGVLPPARDVE